PRISRKTGARTPLAGALTAATGRRGFGPPTARPYGNPSAGCIGRGRKPLTFGTGKWRARWFPPSALQPKCSSSSNGSPARKAIRRSLIGFDLLLSQPSWCCRLNSALLALTLNVEQTASLEHALQLRQSTDHHPFRCFRTKSIFRLAFRHWNSDQE